MSEINPVKCPFLGYYLQQECATHQTLPPAAREGRSLHPAAMKVQHPTHPSQELFYLFSDATSGLIRPYDEERWKATLQKWEKNVEGMEWRQSLQQQYGPVQAKEIYQKGLREAQREYQNLSASVASLLEKAQAHEKKGERWAKAAFYLKRGALTLIVANLIFYYVAKIHLPLISGPLRASHWAFLVGLHAAQTRPSYESAGKRWDDRSSAALLAIGGIIYSFLDGYYAGPLSLMRLLIEVGVGGGPALFLLYGTFYFARMHQRRGLSYRIRMEGSPDVTLSDLYKQTLEKIDARFHPLLDQLLNKSKKKEGSQNKHQLLLTLSNHAEEFLKKLTENPECGPSSLYAFDHNLLESGLKRTLERIVALANAMSENWQPRAYNQVKALFSQIEKINQDEKGHRAVPRNATEQWTKIKEYTLPRLQKEIQEQGGEVKLTSEQFALRERCHRTLGLLNQLEHQQHKVVATLHQLHRQSQALMEYLGCEEKSKNLQLPPLKGFDKSLIVECNQIGEKIYQKSERLIQRAMQLTQLPLPEGTEEADSQKIKELTFDECLAHLQERLGEEEDPRPFLMQMLEILKKEHQAIQSHLRLNGLPSQTLPPLLDELEPSTRELEEAVMLALHAPQLAEEREEKIRALKEGSFFAHSFIQWVQDPKRELYEVNERGQRTPTAATQLLIDAYHFQKVL